MNDEPKYYDPVNNSNGAGDVDESPDEDDDDDDDDDGWCVKCDDDAGDVQLPSGDWACWACLADLYREMADENAALKATAERLQSQNTAIRGKNAELWATVERLTPKKMTLQGACDVLNAKNHLYASDWRVNVAATGSDGKHMVMSCQTVLTGTEAVYIAQGLLRDAAPQEPEGGR